MPPILLRTAGGVVVLKLPRQDNLIRTLTLRNRTITASTSSSRTIANSCWCNCVWSNDSEPFACCRLESKTSCCAYFSETTSQDTSFGLVSTSFAMDWASVVYSRFFRLISFQPLLQWRSDARLQTSWWTIFWRQRQRTWPLRRRVSNGIGCCHDAQTHSTSIHCRKLKLTTVCRRGHEAYGATIPKADWTGGSVQRRQRQTAQWTNC